MPSSLASLWAARCPTVSKRPARPAAWASCSSKPASRVRQASSVWSSAAWMRASKQPFWNCSSHVASLASSRAATSRAERSTAASRSVSNSWPSARRPASQARSSASRRREAARRSWTSPRSADAVVAAPCNARISASRSACSRCVSRNASANSDRNFAMAAASSAKSCAPHITTSSISSAATPCADAMERRKHVATMAVALAAG
mmetsp:Transcript_118789/g.330157  ORF Transcript_118789/g.330157 Transcript_118789/m.330157 type:complete len:205 (-) Transcript_118789:95-709(-)